MMSTGVPMENYRYPMQRVEFWLWVLSENRQLFIQYVGICGTFTSLYDFRHVHSNCPEKLSCRLDNTENRLIYFKIIMILFLAW